MEDLKSIDESIVSAAHTLVSLKNSLLKTRARRHSVHKSMDSKSKSRISGPRITQPTVRKRGVSEGCILTI